MPKLKGDEAIVSALSEEEREALVMAGELEGEEDETEEDDDTEALRQLAEEADDDEEDDDEEEEVEGDGKVIAAAEDDPLALLKKPDGEAGNAPPELPPEDVFISDARVPVEEIEGYDTKLTELQTRSAELRQQFADGEKSQAEYLDAKEKLDDERIAIVADKSAAIRHNQSVYNREVKHWNVAQEAFFKAPENQIFTKEKDPILFEALNAAVKDLASKNPNMSGHAVLREARLKVAERMKLPGEETKPAASKAADAEKARKAAIAARVKAADNERKRVPRTLADLPQADDADESLNAGEFDHIDAMLESDDPVTQRQAEQMIARMKPDEAARFSMVR